MTCVIGFIDRENKILHMIGDSLGSNGYTGEGQKVPKIFRSRDSENILIGSAGSFRQSDILMYNSFFDETDILRNKKIDHEYMVTKFIPTLQYVLSKEGLLIEELGEKKGGNFLIGNSDNLYEVQDDFSILENISSFNAIGSGENFAKGSLFTTKEMDLTIKAKLIIAISAAEQYSTGVSRPFIYMNTDGEYEIIN